MNRLLSLLFFEDFLVGTILPNESAWEALRIDGKERIPLYFHVSGGQVRNDAFAQERVEANDPCAYGSFYEAAAAGAPTFRRFDLERRPVELLHDALERLKSAYVERMRAFGDDLGGKPPIRVNVCFAPGISDAARAAIAAYLVEEGFEWAGEADYLEAFLKSLQRKGIIPSRINLAVVDASFGDLRFHYLEVDERIVKRETEVLLGRGVDYRVGNLARLLVEKAGRKCASRLVHDRALLEQEVKRFHRRAAVEMENFEFDELDVHIELSDYCKARVIVDRAELERVSAESFAFIQYRFESFISKHSNLARTERILLTGGLLSSEEFVQFFSRAFGASKLVPPMENFVELLSRGVVATLSPASVGPQDGVQTESQVEIKITVIKKPTAPPVPPRPSVSGPARDRPPLPRVAEPGQPPAWDQTTRPPAPPPVPPRPPARPPAPPGISPLGAAGDGAKPPSRGAAPPGAPRASVPPPPRPPSAPPRPPAAPPRPPPPPPLPPTKGKK